MKPIAILLEPEEQVRLRRIVLDQSQEEALKFLKTCLLPKVDKLSQPHCVPPFEKKL